MSAKLIKKTTGKKYDKQRESIPNQRNIRANNYNKK